jgi:cytochrome c-type biogenesis protein CcmH/NrfG
VTTHHNDSLTPLTVITGVAGVFAGVIMGYIVGVNHPTRDVASAVPVAAPVPVATGGVSEQDLQPYRAAIAADPKNVRAIVDLGNRLYDAGRYAEAVPYYAQGFTLDPKNVSVSTDLATALYYAGQADKALGQFDVSLALDPNHAQTLFNIGIVKRDAKNDPQGAIAIWERLLRSVPDYPDTPKVKSMIAELKQRTS